MYQGHESQYRKQRFTISHSISAYPDTMNGYCFLLLTLIYVPTVSGWVTQLAECGRYNGNFTERQNGKYFRSECDEKRMCCILHHTPGNFNRSFLYNQINGFASNLGNIFRVAWAGGSPNVLDVFNFYRVAWETIWFGNDLMNVWNSSLIDIWNNYMGVQYTT